MDRGAWAPSPLLWGVPITNADHRLHHSHPHPTASAASAVQVSVKTGAMVKPGQQLVVMNAMKMETAICAPVSGVITQVAVEKNDALDAGDLVVYIDTTAVGAVEDPLSSGSDDDDEVQPEGGKKEPAMAA